MLSSTLPLTPDAFYHLQWVLPNMRAMGIPVPAGRDAAKGEEEGAALSLCTRVLSLLRGR